MDQRVETLTDAFCRAQQAPASGRLEFTDLRCAGLSFRVTAKGVRSFCFRFRDPVTRATTRATIGAYPDIGLSDARTRADAMRVTVASGARDAPRPRSGLLGPSLSASWSNTRGAKSARQTATTGT
jgi:Arm DNA-binding domain